jgi:hypothetical protein
MKSPEQQFFSWLQLNDPFMYRVVMAKMGTPVDPQEGLAFWGAIGAGLAQAGKAVLAAAPSYIKYKQGKDADKLAKAKIKLQTAQAKAQQASFAMPIQAPPRQASYPPQVQPLPVPNKSAITEILERLQIAMKGGQQPPTTTYTPFVNAAELPANAPERVAAGEGGIDNKTLMIGGGILAAALLLR